MAKQTWIKVGGVWKQVTNIWIKISGVWISGVISWRKISGTWRQCQDYSLIETDTNSISMAYQDDSYSDYCAIDVTPDSMETTIAKINTGDGVTWATLLPAGGTGDYSFRMQATSENSNSWPRSMTARIEDVAGLADPVDITVTQQGSPL